MQRNLPVACKLLSQNLCVDDQENQQEQKLKQ